MEPEEPKRPRSLRSPQAVEARLSMLQEQHVARLTDFVKRLRKDNAGEFPYFDPFDGGVNAEILFLFEKPGPMTSKLGKGSGFISRDNDDPTAEATFRFMQEAKIPRKKTIMWNLVPGWNNTRSIKACELQSGVEGLKRLLEMLPKLGAIVLVGRKAQSALPKISPLIEKSCGVFHSAHPSPLVRAAHPVDWQAIAANWALAAESLRRPR